MKHLPKGPILLLLPAARPQAISPSPRQSYRDTLDSDSRYKRDSSAMNPRLPKSKKIGQRTMQTIPALRPQPRVRPKHPLPFHIQQQRPVQQMHVLLQKLVDRSDLLPPEAMVVALGDGGVRGGVVVAVDFAGVGGADDGEDVGEGGEEGVGLSDLGVRNR